MRWLNIFTTKNLFKRDNVSFFLWMMFFCYSVCAALIFQKLLLPHLSSIQTGSGLITNDANYFDSVARAMAEQIKLHGWSSWQLYPANGAPGNVAILGALYVLFGYDPSLAIPINAALHALGGLTLYFIARELSQKESVGIYAGIIAGSLFVIFPSALVWYGQNHKDGYAVAGMLLILLVWIKAIKNPSENKTWGLIALGSLTAIVLVGMVRPFGLKLLAIVALGILIAVLFNAVLVKGLSSQKKLLTYFILVVLMLMGGMKATEALGGLQSDTSYANWQSNTGVSNKGDSNTGEIYKNWQWRNSAWLPGNIEGYIEVAARTRIGLIVFSASVNAKSMIDEHIVPKNIIETTTYLPRALQVALFAPFPSSWVENVSITRLVAVAEMFIYYLCVPGVLLLLFYNRKPAVLMTIYFACFFLVVYGFTQANLGTLYRYRYAYLFVILMLGVLGWVTWLDKTDRLLRLINQVRPNTPIHLIEDSHVVDQKIKRKEALGSGFIVMGLTLLCFIGFFLRDIMMAQKFGLGGALDSFFIALLIPMFVVTVLCMPLGAAFIPVYMGLKDQLKPQAAGAFVSGVSYWVMLSLLLVSIVIYLFGPTILPWLNFKGGLLNIGKLVLLQDIALLILLFSGVVILGNSVLNANGRAVLTSTAQLVVPITAILALVLFGDSYGVKAVMFGMVVGQLLNLVIVQYYLKDYDVSLLPWLAANNRIELSPLLLQYLPLVVAAFFAAAAAPVATFLAISLPAGGVSAFNLGNKVVLFVTGLVGTTVSTVMLPYFSTLIAKKHLMSARRELSFFLLVATFVSIPISASLYIWSEPIVRLIFERGTFDNTATELVTRVMQYAVIQLPFFVCNTLLLKFAIATKHVLAISVVTIIGLLVNIGASIFLMQYMGVAGIALGASLSMAFITVLIVLILARYSHISKFDALIMLLNWLMFITLLVSLHFQSISSAYITIFAYLILLTGYLSSLRSDKFLTP